MFGFLFAFLMTAFSVDVDAQYRRKKKKKKKKPTTERNSEYFDESGGDIKDKLWYGADVTIEFGSAIGVSEFTYGLSPMVGYKFTEDFSAGPRISFANSIQKFGQQNGADVTLNAIDLGGGVWSRHKVFANYFVHGEIEFISEEIPDGSGITIDDNNRVITTRQANTRYYLGAGYGGGAGGGFDFTGYLLWDFSQEFSSSNIPLVYRIGVTYNF